MNRLSTLNSIINSNSIESEVTDTINPYSFIEFLSKCNFENSSEAFQTYYGSYLTAWADVKQTEVETISTKKLIQNQVIELLKVITVSYTTEEERHFLANLDWNYDTISNPAEKQRAKNALYSALPIFVSRIKEIASFYRKKRSEATFSIKRNQIRGTKSSIEKIIYDNILEYLFNNDPTKVNYVQSYLNVAIDTYIDVYSDYFDVERAKSNTQDYNDVDWAIYFTLEDVLKDMIFDGNVYLIEIPLIAQLNVDLSQDCVGEKLVLKNELLAKKQLTLVSDTEKIALKKKLYEKYLGVDFHYYVQYADGTSETGVFIKAENPTNNLLNQQTADTPYTVSTQLELLKNIGLFFKPGYMSILRVNASNFSYSIDQDKVEVDTVYIFPDPTLYGNVAFNKQAEYPLIIEYSFSEYSKNFNFGWASGDPLVRSREQPVYPYYSREQDINNINKNHVLTPDFNDLYNRGFISTLKTDLYGNRFAIFKEQSWNHNTDSLYFGKFTRQWDIELADIEEEYSADTSNVLYIIDGGVLGEDDQYGTSKISADRYPEWDNSLSTKTYYYDKLVEGGIGSYNTSPSPPIRAYIPDNASIGTGDFTRSVLNLPSSIALPIVIADAASFITDYAYATLASAVGVPKIISLNNKFGTQLYHASGFTDDEKAEFEANKDRSVYEIEQVKGQIYIFMSAFHKSFTLLEAFDWWNSGIDVEHYHYFVNNAVDFDVLENTIFIKAINPETKAVNYLVESFEYSISENKFVRKFTNQRPILFMDGITGDNVYPACQSLTFEEALPDLYPGNANISNIESNIFYIEQLHKCYMAVMSPVVTSVEIQGNEVSYPIFVPEVYEFDLSTCTCKKYIFELTDGINEQAAESFRIPNTLYAYGTVPISKAGSICLTYSSDINTFMLTYIVYDSNYAVHLYKHFFKLRLSASAKLGYIDDETIDSTIYSPNTTKETTVITPGDTNNTLLNLYFATNIIVS